MVSISSSCDDSRRLTVLRLDVTVDNRQGEVIVVSLLGVMTVVEGVDELCGELPDNIFGNGDVVLYVFLDILEEVTSFAELHHVS